MNLRTMHIGLDDTDSTRKGCTTYVAALLVERLERLNASFIDYPNLIRLNPNVPWKTRGNGALCLRIQYNENSEDKIKEVIIQTVEQNADLEFTGTDPGVVFFERERIPVEVQNFARNAIVDVVTLKDAVKLLRKFNGEALGFKKGRGIIGGLAAVGETLRADHTFEILAYRTPENYGSKRRVDENSIFEMDRTTAPYTFNNVDAERGRVIITPRGPDPILLGVRGETPDVVKEAYQLIRPFEPVERWVIFRTNQGTDAHLIQVTKLSRLRPHLSVSARGIVATDGRLIPGRHVIFSIRDESAQVECAAYEPTGSLRRMASSLIVGDSIEVFGAVRAPLKDRPLTINLEKIRVLKLAPKILYQNPTCPKCSKRLKSMGKNQGLRCERCGFQSRKAWKVETRVERQIRKGLYITSARSQRHLTKPSVRYGKEKTHGKIKKLIADWHFP